MFGWLFCVYKFLISVCVGQDPMIVPKSDDDDDDDDGGPLSETSADENEMTAFHVSASLCLLRFRFVKQGAHTVSFRAKSFIGLFRSLCLGFHFRYFCIQVMII